MATQQTTEMSKGAQFNDLARFWFLDMRGLQNRSDLCSAAQISRGGGAVISRSRLEELYAEINDHATLQSGCLCDTCRDIEFIDTLSALYKVVEAAENHNCGDGLRDFQLEEALAPFDEEKH